MNVIHILTWIDQVPAWALITPMTVIYAIMITGFVLTQD